MLGQNQIVKWRRLDINDYTFYPGDSDLEVWVSKDDILYILMFECKREDGQGTHLDSQKECEIKYKPYKNVRYKLIKSVFEMQAAIEEVTEFNQKILDGIQME